MTATRLATLDLPEGNAMRAPGEAPGMMALEIAMDEMAEKLGIDPVELRIRQRHPGRSREAASGRSRSASSSSACAPAPSASAGASATRSPAQVRDGRWLVGMGMAAAFRNNLLTKSAARVRLDGQRHRDGRDRHDRHRHRQLHDHRADRGRDDGRAARQGASCVSAIPPSRSRRAPAGSGARNNSTAGVYAACVKLREAVAQKLGFNSADAEFADGQVRVGQSQRAARRGRGATASSSPKTRSNTATSTRRTSNRPSARISSRSASMPRPAEIRVRRMLAVCAAGRILNPKTARSQVIGAMTMGVGAALMEELVVDKRRGFFVNHDLAGYEVPVHADIPHQEVIFLDETDPMSSPMKAKGVGELGICGVAAAVANAIYNATGVRVRDYPITLDKLLERMPEVG